MDKSVKDVENDKMEASKNTPEPQKEPRSVHATCTLSGANPSMSNKVSPAITIQVPRSPRSSSPKPYSGFKGSSSKTKNDEASSPHPTPQAILRSKQKHKLVRLNVGGKIHTILWKKLRTLPDTRLGQLEAAKNHNEILQFCNDYSLQNNEYFFDRQPKIFNIFLNLYRTSKLHLTDEVCVMEYIDEMEYWGMDESLMDQCCQLKLQQRRDAINDEMKKDTELVFLVEEQEFGDGCIDKLKRNVWDLFEKSLTVPQRIIGCLSLFFILLSVLTLSLSTVPELQQLHCKISNMTLCERAEASRVANSMTMEEAVKNFSNALEIREHYVLHLLEIICVIWFSCEYLARLFASPNKIKFFQGYLNTIDLIAILPFYVSLFLVHFDTAGRVLQVLRVIRILRIFKLARHSIGLQSLGFTLRHSYQNLGVLLLFIAVGVVIFSALGYFAERDVNKKGFESIPHTFYWGLITMTTVGYGDIVPTTIIGKIISMVAGVCGLVVIALPVGIISNNFQLFYDEQTRKEKAMKRRKDMDVMKDRRESRNDFHLSLGDELNPFNGDGET